MALVWHKSRFSNPSGNCVEIAWGTYAHAAKQNAEVFIRDSKDADGPWLEFTAAEWDAFVKGVQAGERELVGSA